MPERIRLSRAAGWRMPPNTVKVDRTTKWGNPFKDGEVACVWHRSAAWPHDLYRDCFRVSGDWHAVALFRHAMERQPDWYHDSWQAPDVAELRGMNLACWCHLGAPCHADVLLELANAQPQSGQSEAATPPICQCGCGDDPFICIEIDGS